MSNDDGAPSPTFEGAEWTWRVADDVSAYHSERGVIGYRVSTKNNERKREREKKREITLFSAPPPYESQSHTHTQMGMKHIMDKVTHPYV